MAVRPPATNSTTVVHPIGSTAGPLIRVVTLLGGVVGAAYVTMGGLEHLEPVTRSYLQPLVFGVAVVPFLLAHAAGEGAALAARSLVVQLLAAALVFYAVMTIAFDDRPGPSLTLRMAVLVASCVEEVVFRVLLPLALVAARGGVPAGQRAMFTSIVASQLVFALCHVLPAGSRAGLVDPLDLGRLVAFGLVAWVAIALVGLWAASAAHAALNIGVLVFGFHAMPTAADIVAAAVIGASGVAGVLAYRARMRPRPPRTPIDPNPIRSDTCKVTQSVRRFTECSGSHCS